MTHELPSSWQETTESVSGTPLSSLYLLAPDDGGGSVTPLLQMLGAISGLWQPESQEGDLPSLVLHDRVGLLPARGTASPCPDLHQQQGLTDASPSHNTAKSLLCE